VSMTNSSDRVEIITSVQPRRRWTAPEKVRMVEETFGLGMTVSLVTRPSNMPQGQKTTAATAVGGRLVFLRAPMFLCMSTTSRPLA